MREAHLVDVDKWDETTWLMYTIEGHHRFRQQKLPLMPSRGRKLYHLDDLDKPHGDMIWTMSALLDGRSDAVRIREWDKEELRSESWEWRKVINWVFLSSVSSLLFSILHYFFESRSGIKGVGTCFTASGSQSMGGWVSPCAGSEKMITLSSPDRL